MSGFREFVLPLDHPRLARWQGHGYREHASIARANEMAARLLDHWSRLASEPFRGITADGRPIPGLYALGDQGAPTEAMAAAAGRLLGLLDRSSRAVLCRPVDAEEWRLWNNAEFYLYDYGLRLEDQPVAVRDAVLALVASSLSEEGYQTTRHTMWLNEFLGKLIGAPAIFNEWSYNFTLFGDVSTTTDPWGWQLMGHHLVLNCLVIGGHMVLSPLFIAAEPTTVEEGPYAGVTALIDRELAGRDLMQSLAPALQNRAQIYVNMVDPRMPPGRFHPADQRHLAGAFQDNRVIPYEGPTAAEFNVGQRSQLLKLVETYLRLLPDGPRSARLASVEEHLGQTYFSWIGGYGDKDAFYYRVQSPVILIEFDHHSGVLLGNEQPQTFHVHTIVRTPNGNDYGKDVLMQHYRLHDHVGQGRGDG